MNNTMNNAFIDDTFDNTEEEIVLDPPTELFKEANTIAQNNENDEKFEFILKYDVNQKDFLLSLLEALGINPSEIHENEDMTISINLNMSQLAFIKKMDFIEEVHSTIIPNPYIFLEAEAASAGDSTTVEIDRTNEEKLIPNPISTENLNIETVPHITPTINTTLTEDEVANNEVATMSVNNSRCSSCISNYTMETAKQINTESFIRGCICCPETEEWFKFTAPETTTYTIYTMGTLDTIGAIYDASGTKITCNDDYVYGGNLNFRIICDLTAGETYYVKVRLDKKATGKYTIRVTKKILAKAVNINQPAISLVKGVTYELPTRPDYVYKGYNGAVPIPDFSVSIYPADTTEQLIYWYEEPFNNTVTCTTGIDDNGERYYHITAVELGTTKLYARDWNDNGRKDECQITVKNWPACNKPNINSRESWGARPVKENRLVERTNSPQLIIFHHPAKNFVSTDINEIKSEIRRIQNLHMLWRGKCDIAYHFIIDPSGSIWQGAVVDEYQRGHAEGHYDDIGVLILGDFSIRDKNPNPNVLNNNQKNAMIEISKWLCYNYNLSINRSTGISPIRTHRMVNPGETVCPGENAAPWIENELTNIINNWSF